MGTPIAWSTSIAIHLLLLVLASIITWSVVRTREDRPPIVISSPQATPTWEPVSSLAAIPVESASEGGLSGAEPSEPIEAADLADLLVATDGLLSDSTALAPLEGVGDAPGVEFGGVAAPAASRVVFVVDASGSMIGAFRAVTREVERTLRQLDGRQSFSVLLFQGDEVLNRRVSPAGLRPATPANVDASVAWMRTVNPKGGSDPIPALEAAFRLDPEVIYLVSTDITGSGTYEIARDELFAELERLNPTGSDGYRNTIIRCIQLLEEDSLGTLREIARRHGVDPDVVSDDGFAFIDRTDLGLD